MMDEHEDDSRLIWRLANGDGAALEPLMERWGDALVDTCFRAVRDAQQALDLYAEVCAEAYARLRYGTESLPEAFGPWAVGVIGDVLSTAAEEEHIPVRARGRLKLPPVRFTAADIDRLEALRDPGALHDARVQLPRDFSAAADRMLLGVPDPARLSRIRSSTQREEQ
jgi:DNA-directed RNA polymerase specialized sigma24 family protein